MDESSRKRTSKWDLIGGERNHEDDANENLRSVNYRASSSEYRSYSGHHSFMHMDENDAKYPSDVKDVRSKYESTLSVRDHASVNRGTWRDNTLDRGNRGFSEAGTNWDDDGGRRNHGRSPRSSWQRPLRSTSRGRSRSRSRSRSPIRAYRHESGMNERPRSKPEVPIQTCRDFTSGRCRRGSHCPYLHPSSQNYEDRRYDFNHREESNQGGKYSQHRASDGYHNDYTVVTLEPKRDCERYSRGRSFNHGVERESRRSSDIPCTFFAAGNCRNGKFCHFSHQIPSSRHSDGRGHDGRWETNHSPEKAGQMDQATRFSDRAEPHSAEFEKERRPRTNRSPGLADQSDQGAEFTETAGPRPVEYEKESHGKDVSSQLKNKVVSSSLKSGWGSDIHSGSTTVAKAVEAEANHQTSQWNTDNPGNITSTSELKPVDSWMEDKMSPEWNPKASSTGTAAKKEPAYAIQTPESLHHNVPLQSSQLTDYPSSVILDVVEKPISQQSLNTSNNGDPGNLSSVGLGQLLHTPNQPGNDKASAFGETANYDKFSLQSDWDDRKALGALSGVMPVSNMVRQEQIAQLTDLSASLAHLLGKGPEFYAAINPPPKSAASVETSNGLVSQLPIEIAKPYPPIGSENSYGPVFDDNGRMQLNTSITPSHYPSNPGTLRTTNDVKEEIPSGNRTTSEEVYTNGNAEGGVSHKSETDSKKPQTIDVDKHVKSQERNPLENLNGEGKAEGGKKVKDTKALREFKYALVNFIKELLKPAWKDSKIDKEGFKTIVKKATDKVTAAIQEANIPQTPEKVEQYLEASKPKLNKLLQAYMDRNLKKRT